MKLSLLKKKNFYPVNTNLIKDFPKRKYKYLYKRMLDEDIIRAAWKNLRKGKTKREAVIKIDANLEEEIQKMKLCIMNTKPENYTVEHPELAYEPPKERKSKIVHEYRKKRTAYLAEIREQWYFHIIVEVLKPLMMNRLEYGVCGCIPGRGMHYGKKIVEKSIKNNINKYFFKADIRHFYNNIRISDVINKLKDLIDDDLFLYCIAKIYKYQSKGILIGLYISPWISNFLLMHMDYTISNIKGIKYIRYVDDIVILCNNKKILRAISILIRYILGKIHLKLKNNYQICLFDYNKENRIDKSIKCIGRPIDFLGFMFYRNKTTIRKIIMINTVKLSKILYKIKQSKKPMYIGFVKGMISRLGWFYNTNSYNCYLKYIKPYISIKKLKSIVSKIDYNENIRRKLL